MEASVFLGVRSCVTASLVVLSLGASSPGIARSPPPPPGPARSASTKAMIERVPEAPARYQHKEARAQSLFTDLGLTLQLTPPKSAPRELHWGMTRAKAVQPQPIEPSAAPKQPSWGALYYPAVTPGVDLWFESQKGGVQYSLRAERGEDLREVRLEWRGVQELRIADQGKALVVKLEGGTLREEGLRCGQEAADGSSREVPCRYREVRLQGTNLWEYVIEVQVEQPDRPAWIDPSIQWNTFVGEAGDDTLENLTVLQGPAIEGQFFFVGTSGLNGLASMDAQGSGTVHGSVENPPDIVVGRRNANGTLIWTSIVGGNGADMGRAFAVGANNDVFVAGSTTSTDFGVGAQGTPFGGGKDGLIVSLTSNGQSVKWFQYIGGSGDEEIYALTLGQDGKLYAAGSTSSPQLAASDAGVGRGGLDLFVSRLNADTGAVERTLVLSGSLNEEARAIVTGELASGGAARLYVTGYTESPDFPMGVTPRIANSQTDGGRESVVLKLNEQLGPPVWGTYLGSATGQDHGQAVLFDVRTQRVLVTGTTGGTDFPTLPPLSDIPQPPNAFLTAFEAPTGIRLFSTVVGGFGEDEGFALATGSYGSVYIGGRTTSTDLPVPFGFDSQSSAREGFVIRMTPDAGRYIPEWGTYVGGALNDEVRALGAGPGNEVLLIAGLSTSAEMLPHALRDGIDNARVGGADMFLIAMDALDLTPPLGEVRDGLTTDIEESTSPDKLEANWSFADPEQPITGYEFGAGTRPGCDDIARFRPVSRDVSIQLTTLAGLSAPLPRGQWYFSSVIAKNNLGLSQTVSSNGFFLPDENGGPTPRPPRPVRGDCPGASTDGGTPDGGGGPQPDGGTGENPVKDSPLGWSCNCGATGGPAGLFFLLLLAVGLRMARREA
jgi:hypothetical protein